MRHLKSILVILFLSGFLALALAEFFNTTNTDYDAELAKIQGDIANVKGNATASAMETASGLSYLLYLRASLTGNGEDARLAKAEIDKTLQTLGGSEDIYLAKANISLKTHQLRDAREVIAKLPDLADSPKWQVLKADIAMQEGNYGEAKNIYDAVVRRKKSWDYIARLAYLKSLFGDVAGADALYAEAEDQISAKEMRSYAWVELQRGLLDFNRGRHETALEHYRQAEKAYSGYWLVDEHMAEWLGAERKYTEAAALFEKILERSPRPEIQQALGDLYVFMGKPEQAKPWHDRALAAYLASAQRGEALYFHHLAAFYADVREDGAEAVKWAGKDLETRGNFAAHDAMAWALYRAGRFDESLAEMKTALATGVSDARLFFHAAMIHLAAGLADEGKQFLTQAAEVNPRYDAFHVHR